ncbi:MAG: asparaginase [Gemmatimonadetes bacterium]|nr:asparaginase [Gemmatimonadota bacterium]
MNENVIEVLRGTTVEARHRVHAAVVDAEGRLRASAGDPELITFFRSSAKPFQAIPLIDDGACTRFGLTSEELALCCGSHSGEPRHVQLAESILRKIGLDGESLACGAHAPFHEPTRRDLADAGREPVRLHNNCSGKHAGMLALARVHGWDAAGYHLLEHPVQGRLLTELSRWVGIPYDAIALATDGCGVVCHALPIRNMALGFAQLAAASRRGEPAASEVVGAMMDYPEMVAGLGRLCTELMVQVEGRMFAKIGAEGVYCVGVPGAELGIALKVEDGGKRAVAPAILAILRQLDLISEEDLGALQAHAFPEIGNSCGEIVGQIRPNIRLTTPHA